MFNILSLFQNFKKTGAGYVILNIIRVLNIITLGLIIAGSWIMLVRTVQTSNFFFFDGVTHFATSTISIFLIFSELCLFKGWFSRNWPLFSEESGLITLALSMTVLGCNLLGNLNKPATSQEAIGMSFWSVVVAGGILGLVFGVINFIAHYAFRIRKKGITSRQIRAHGAKVLLDDLPKSVRSNSTGPRSFELPQYTKENENRQSKFKLGNFKFNNPIRSSLISRPVPTNTEQFKEWEDRCEPINHLQVPPPARQHPAYTASVYSRNSGAF
ncbi:hypothetical protein VE02_03793 [Pseudogymnoascus sp. 03VT05]|nr:hypothetical protein VE02_03793 [Pseudogymnoascus sp. 03VT05]